MNGIATITGNTWVDLEEVIEDLVLTEGDRYNISIEGRGRIINATEAPSSTSVGFPINNSIFGYVHGAGKLFVISSNAIVNIGD